MPKIEKELYLAEKAVPQKNLHNRLPQSFKGYERMKLAKIRLTGMALKTDVSGPAHAPVRKQNFNFDGGTTPSPLCFV